MLDKQLPTDYRALCKMVKRVIECISTLTRRQDKYVVYKWLEKVCIRLINLGDMVDAVGGDCVGIFQIAAVCANKAADLRDIVGKNYTGEDTPSHSVLTHKHRFLSTKCWSIWLNGFAAARRSKNGPLLFKPVNDYMKNEMYHDRVAIANQTKVR